MSTTSGIRHDSAWDEADQLISILRSWGIGYLVGEDHPISPSDIARDRQSAVALIRRLARCEYPRVRDASISLFLLHPELAPAVLEAIQTSEPAVSEQITTLTLATLYLQRLWSLRLTMALGREPSFPEQPFAHLWQSRRLPPPSYHNGKWGLLALQEAEQQRTNLPFTFLHDWQNQSNHLLLQEEAYHRRYEVPITPLAVQDELGEQERGWVEPNVDKVCIERFFQKLGQAFHKSGRLYLVGGAALVHMGIRSGPTQGIDVEVSGSNEEDMYPAIRSLAGQMKINVEFASPRDFIPLPSQWEMNARYVGRYGSIEVFYFDFYSIALSKIDRGNTRDINDVKLLLQQGIITLEELDTAYQEVLAQMGKGTYAKLDPQRFAERYAAMRQLL